MMVQLTLRKLNTNIFDIPLGKLVLFCLPEYLDSAMPLACSNSFRVPKGGLGQGIYIDTDRTPLFHSQCCQEFLKIQDVCFFRESLNFPFTSLRVENQLAPPIFAIPKGLILVLRPCVIFMGVPPQAN